MSQHPTDAAELRGVHGLQGRSQQHPLDPIGDGPDPITRQEILLAAAAVIEFRGIREFTVRGLADQLGVPVAALDRMFGTRDELLDGIVEVVIDEVYADPDIQTETVEWQEYLQRVAHGVRRVARNHPHVFSLIATRPQSAPWIQPPLRSLRWMERFLATLHRAGFSDRAAVSASRAFSGFLLGHLLLEVTALGGSDTAAVQQPDLQPAQPVYLSDYPHLNAIQAELTRPYTEDEFEEALESLLDRLEGQGLV